MELTQTRKEDFVILGIRGRLDTTNYTSLEKELMVLIEGRTTRIIVNCSEMDYVSSSGLRVLLLALKMITRENGKFILCSLKENIREIFEISGFTSIFPIFSSEEEAIKAI
jgi:anti-sigma B factor antagonist